MKKNLVVAFVALCVIALSPRAQAQGKIGYISLQELIVAMPEYKQAEKDMADYQQALTQQSTDYFDEYKRKDSIMTVDSTTWTSALREIKRKEVNELYLRYMNFNREAQQLIQKREQELLAPIQQKAVTTTQAVAKESGYAYILSKEQLISFPASDDVLPLVAKKLNLKLDTAKPDAPKAGGK